MFGRKRKKTEKDQLFEAEMMVHLDALYGAGMRLSGNPGDAEDLVQETCLKAYRSLHLYKPGTNAKAWLLRILTNTFINNYRKRRNAARVISDLDLAEHQDRLLQPEEMKVWSNPETAFFQRDVQPQVIEALDQLSEDYRTVVVLADLQEMSYREIADAMETPIGTVMSRLYRARRQLQSKLFDFAVEQGYLALPERGEQTPISLEEYRERRRSGGGEEP